MNRKLLVCIRNKNGVLTRGRVYEMYYSFDSYNERIRNLYTDDSGNVREYYSGWGDFVTIEEWRDIQLNVIGII